MSIFNKSTRGNPASLSTSETVSVLTWISETESSPLRIEWPYSRSLRKKLVSPRWSDTAALISTQRSLKAAVLRCSNLKLSGSGSTNTMRALG